MNREEVKKLLGESATEEQISAVLDKFHTEQKELRTQVSTLQTNVTNLTNTNVELTEYKNKYTELEKANMTKEQLLEAREKEISGKLQELEEKSKKANLLTNSIKAKSILVGAGIGEKEADELVNSIVREDENATIASAELLATQFRTIEENTAKKTKEELLTTNIKPNPSNVTGGSQTMTKENFLKLSQAEQDKFIKENPEEFYKL